VSFNRTLTSWNHKLKTIQGIYPAFPGNVTWISVNLAGDYKRAAGMAIYIGIGNLAGGKFHDCRLHRTLKPHTNPLSV